jgi:hypothetical protein
MNFIPARVYSAKTPNIRKQFVICCTLSQRIKGVVRCGGVIISCGCLLPFDIGPGRFQQFGHQRAEKKQATEEALLFKRVPGVYI